MSEVAQPLTTTPVLKNLEGEPLSPCRLCLVHCQGPCIDVCRPGWWCPGAIRHARVTWKLTDASLDQVRNALTAGAPRLGNYDVMTSRDGTWTARFYTPKLQWLDKIEISLVATDGGVTADAWSKSLGCCPTSVPGALLGGWLCVCFPFNDHGKNLTHLTELKGLLVEAGIAVEETIVVRGAAREAAPAPPGESMAR